MIVGSMVVGSLIVMWIGEIITEFKMGNGISIMILSGIVSKLPGSVYKILFGNPDLGSTGVVYNTWEAITRVFTHTSSLLDWEKWKGFWYFNGYWAPTRNIIFFTLIFLVTLTFVVFINDAVRKLVIIYSRRGHNEGMSRTIGQVKSDLPVKVNQAGVIPIIFSVSFILFPSIIARFFQTANQQGLRQGAKAVSDFLSADSKTGSHFLSYQISNKVDAVNGVKFVSSPTTLQNYTGLNWSEGFSWSKLNIDWLPQFTWTFNGVLAYNFFYFFLIVFFTYFYTTIIFNTEEISEDLQKNGAYIPGFRPGTETSTYLSGVSNRLNVAGSIFLAIIALVPILFSNAITFGDSNVNGIIGGTSLLILVAVTIETLKQIETQAISIDYDRFSK
jgi:preprotein translocase subunit SecY